MFEPGGIIVTVYSSFKNISQPSKLVLNFNSRSNTLVNEYLSKHNLCLIDPNLIKVKKIERHKYSDSNITELHNENYSILRPNQLIGNQHSMYYLSLEVGIFIKVNIFIDKKKTYIKHISISPVTNANQLYNLVIKAFTKLSYNSVYNLCHDSGDLKPIDLPVMVLQKTGSNEFQIELSIISKNEEIIKNDILKQLETDYGNIISPTIDYRVSKSGNNLSKVLYHNSQNKKQRKLPQLSKSFSTERINSHFDDYHLFNYINMVSGDILEKENKRSLPRTPAMSPTKVNICTQQNLDLEIQAIENKGLTVPPKPLIKTNALIEDINSSSSSSSQTPSLECETHNNSSETKFRNSVIPKMSSKEFDFSYPNFYQLVKFCNFLAIDFSIKSNAKNIFPIALKDEYFPNVISPTNNRPVGPTPLIGCDKSAFIIVENGTEKKNSVVVIDYVHKIDLNFCNNNIEKSDILVNIDGENVLSKSKEYIYSKFDKNIKHEIILARYKHLTENNKTTEKDEKIIQLKRELDNLKKKYGALHCVTIGNNEIIQQLNKQLNHQQLTTNIVNIK